MAKKGHDEDEDLEEEESSDEFDEDENLDEEEEKDSSDSDYEEW